MVKFNTTKSEAELIRRIADRAVRMAVKVNMDYELMAAEMDVTAAHANGCRLKLKELLAAPEFDFAHDVFGIARHLDRETGQLRDFFQPRFAA